MRFSHIWLTLKYVNRDPKFVIGAYFLALAAGLFLLMLGFMIGGAAPRSPLLIGSTCAFAFAIAAVPIWLILRAVREIRGSVRLIADGLPALGRIQTVEIDFAPSGLGPLPYVKAVHYSYQIHTGAILHAKLTSHRYSLGDIKEGDPVLVIYDPADPFRTEIDRFDARRADRMRLVADATNPRGAF